MISIQSFPFKATIFGLIILLFATSPADSATVEVGIAATVVGEVLRSDATIKKPIRIQRRQRLAWGDTLSTKKKSKLQILLLDRSTLTIGSNARLTINRFVYDPGKKRSFGATVSKGAFRFMSGRKTKESSATVRSSVGTIGIRGTALDGVVGKDAVQIAKKEPFLKGVKGDNDTATLVVLRGPGPNRRGDLEVGLATIRAAGKTVTLDQPILAAYIPKPGAKPIGPFNLSASGLSKLQDLNAPVVTNANKSNFLGKLLPAVAIGIGAGLFLSGEDGEPAEVPATAGNDECVDTNGTRIPGCF